VIVNDNFTLSNVTPTKIVQSSQNPQRVYLHNMSKSSNNFVHLGSADMTLLNSIHIDPGESLTIELMQNDELFAMSDTNGIKVGVLNVRQP
jgi:hypothetical protein